MESKWGLQTTVIKHSACASTSLKFEDQWDLFFSTSNNKISKFPFYKQAIYWYDIIYLIKICD